MSRRCTALVKGHGCSPLAHPLEAHRTCRRLRLRLRRYWQSTGRQGLSHGRHAHSHSSCLRSKSTEFAMQVLAHSGVAEYYMSGMRDYSQSKSQHIHLGTQTIHCCGAGTGPPWGGRITTWRACGTTSTSTATSSPTPPASCTTSASGATLQTFSLISWCFAHCFQVPAAPHCPSAAGAGTMLLRLCAKHFVLCFMPVSSDA